MALGSFAWKALSMGAGVLATKAANTAISTSWRATTGKKAPTDLERIDKATNKEAVGYVALSAAIMAGTQLAAQRAAATYYQRSAGHVPPALMSKQEQKAFKAAQKNAYEALVQANKAARAELKH